MSPALVAALEQLAVVLGKVYVDYQIRQVYDKFNQLVIEFFQAVDHDGDGIVDEEVIIHTIQSFITDLGDGYTLVSDGETVGLGLPAIRIIDGIDIGAFIDVDDPITINGDGYLVDMDGDMDCDDRLIPLQDFTGDGYNDWGWIIDSDENGVPDVSPDSPYYPVGSEGYYEIINAANADNGVMTKDFDDYTVTEAMLFILVILGLVTFIKGLFRKREVF